jgi:hypothetical protein
MNCLRQNHPATSFRRCLFLSLHAGVLLDNCTLQLAILRKPVEAECRYRFVEIYLISMMFVFVGSLPGQIVEVVTEFLSIPHLVYVAETWRLHILVKTSYPPCFTPIPTVAPNSILSFIIAITSRFLMSAMAFCTLSFFKKQGYQDTTDMCHAPQSNSIIIIDLFP